MVEGEPLLRIHWLGTSSGLPTRGRDLSCLVAEVGRRLILLDAGEGAQLSLLRRGFNISAVDAVLVTHRHGDHCFGLPGLYGTWWLMGRPLPPLVGDGSVQALLSEVQRITTGDPGSHPRVLIEDERAPREVLRLAPRKNLSVSVVAGLLDHRVPAHGFRLDVTRRHPPRVDAAALAALGIPPGPIYGRIQRGEDVVLEDGRRLEAGQLAVPGWQEVASFAYLTDTRYCRGSVALARGADLISHEATFLPGQEARAREVGHSTAADAIRVLRESGAGRLVLTHFSARNPIAAYADAARDSGLGDRITLAEDGLCLEVSGRQAPSA